MLNALTGADQEIEWEQPLGGVGYPEGSMFHLIGVVVVVVLVLAFIGWLITPTVVVVVQEPDQPTSGDDFDPRPALEAMAQNLGRELKHVDRQAQAVFHRAGQSTLRPPPPAPPANHKATIEEYRDRIRRGEN